MSAAAQRLSDENIGYVRAVAFSPDGKQIASGSTDGTVRVWDAMTGKQLRVFPGHKYSVSFVHFAPKENHLLSAAGDGTVYVWDLLSGKQVRDFRLGHVTFQLAPLPDSKTLMSGRGNSFYDFWDITNGTLLRSISQEDPYELDSVFAVTPDAKRFLSRGAFNETKKAFDVLRLRDIDTGQDIRRIQQEDDAQVIAVASDGKTALVGGSEINLWDIASGTLTRKFSTREAGVRGLAFSPDGGMMVSVGYGNDAGSIYRSSGSVKLWNVATGKMIREFAGHNRPVNVVAFSPDGKRFVTGGDDVGQSPLRLWDVTTGREVYSLPQNFNTKRDSIARKK